MTALPDRLVLVGAGKMGGAMLEGWLDLGLKPDALCVVEPKPSPALENLCRARAIRLNPEPAALASPAVLVLAIKPQMLETAAASVAPFIGGETLLVSILAGKRISDLRSHLPGAQAIVRAMPNTPAAVGRGITGTFASAEVTNAQRDTAGALLVAVGRIEWLAEESQIDAVTAVSGSGPAYVFLLAECMAEAGIALGLPADLAARLARATVEGAGELMFRSPETTPAVLRQNVTSPGGTTAAALDVLMGEGRLQELMTRAIAAARRRAQELSG